MWKSSRPVGLAAALLSILSIAGCATIEMGQFDDIPVTTRPAGASVSSTTGSSCVSPCVVGGPRGEDIAKHVPNAIDVTLVPKK